MAPYPKQVYDFCPHRPYTLWKREGCRPPNRERNENAAISNQPSDSHLRGHGRHAHRCGTYVNNLGGYIYAILGAFVLAVVVIVAAQFVVKKAGVIWWAGPPQSHLRRLPRSVYGVPQWHSHSEEDWVGRPELSAGGHQRPQQLLSLPRSALRTCGVNRFHLLPLLLISAHTPGRLWPGVTIILSGMSDIVRKNPTLKCGIFPVSRLLTRLVLH